MLIIGAKGFAKEVLEILYQLNLTKNVYFFDDLNKDEQLLFNKYKIIHDLHEVEELFTRDPNFTIGIGNPLLRKKMFDKFIQLNGNFTSTISPLAQIGHFDVEIGKGCNIMTGSIITNSVKIGQGSILNISCTVGHDTCVEDFVEISPNVSISGNCYIGSYTTIGTSAVILPNVKIGKNVTVGAGAVVTKDLPDYCTAVGVPAKIIKYGS
ncbi:MAG TPA: hexapeptide transferase [Flavobacteriales bacterium]|nr:hexapeptide transferase [Flavobacteriales bacterium]|tara:strand:- start:46243 stop:46872 length:630 start_codon:yes stop_codon:yes gene_type:complete